MAKIRKTPIANLQVGDVIMPPPREVSLWMKRRAAEQGLPESALYLTIAEVSDGGMDIGGRWIKITADHTPEWIGDSKPHPFVFKARRSTLWQTVAAKALGNR